MKTKIKKIIKKLLPLIDILVIPLIYPSAFLLKMLRKAGVGNMPLCKSALMRVGVFPILNHYYEPLFDARHLSVPLSDARVLPGIDRNVREQLSILNQFDLNDEKRLIPLNKLTELEFILLI